MSVRLQALPAMAELWDALEGALADQGIAIAVADFGGFRTAADTAEILAYKQADYDAYAARARAAGRNPVPITGAWENGGPRPIASYGLSFHDYGAARDVAIVSTPAGMSSADAIAAVDAAAEGVGLETGASYGDPLHVQLPISIDEARGEWADYVAAGGDGSASSSVAAWAVLAIAIGVVWVGAKYARGLQSWR